MEFNVQVRNSQFEKSLLNKLARVANRLEQEVETELKASFSLTFSQFRVLNTLLAMGEVSQRELANGLGVTPAVVTRQAEVLHGRGLVIQRGNPRSKREKMVALTHKGEAAALDAAAAIKDIEAAWRSQIKLQDEVTLERVLDQLK
jgi:DNA-binding MarR family transcriptional regulator